MGDYNSLYIWSEFTEFLDDSDWGDDVEVEEGPKNRLNKLNKESQMEEK